MPTLGIDIDARLAKFEASMKKMESTVSKAASAMNTALGGIGVALSGGGLAMFVKSAIDAADDLDDLAQKTGATVESLSALGYAAKIEGVNIDALSAGLRKLSVNLQEGAGGSKELQSAFRAVGIAQQELATLSADEALRRIADAFANAEDGAGKTALAVKILGRAGADFIPLLNQGSAGLRAAADEAQRFGLIVSSDAARAAGPFNDNMTRLSESTRSLGVSLANIAVPTLTRFTKELLEGTRIFGGFASALYNIGFAIDPFKNVGENIAVVRKELELFERQRRNSANEGNTNLGGFDRTIEQLRKRLEFLQWQQRQSIETGNASTFDARDRRLQGGGPRDVLQLPSSGDLRSSASTGQIEKATERAAEFMARIYTDQFAEIRRAALELQGDLVAILQQGPDEASRQVAARAAALEGLLGETQIGKVRKLRDLLDELARAGAKAPIEMQEQYEQAFEIINVEIERTKGNLELVAEPIDEAEKGMLRLRAAIDGWGDASAEEIVRFVRTGKMQFSSLVDTVLSDLARLTIQQTVTRPLFSAFAGLLSPANAPGGAPAGGGGTFTGLKFSFGGERAAGGPVSAGTAYLVGERGPELFIPKSGGQIIPNGGGGASPVNVYVYGGTDPALLRAAAYQGAALANSQMGRAARIGAMS